MHDRMSRSRRLKGIGGPRAHNHAAMGLVLAAQEAPLGGGHGGGELTNDRRTHATTSAGLLPISFRRHMYRLSEAGHPPGMES